MSRPHNKILDSARPKGRAESNDLLRKRDRKYEVYPIENGCKSEITPPRPT